MSNLILPPADNFDGIISIQVEYAIGPEYIDYYDNEGNPVFAESYYAEVNWNNQYTEVQSGSQPPFGYGVGVFNVPAPSDGIFDLWIVADYSQDYRVTVRGRSATPWTIQGTNSLSVSDLVIGSAYGDTVSLGAGEDTAFGGGGADRMVGGDGGDLLDGQSGDDSLSGDAGADTLNGGVGADLLRGGLGNDGLQGGDGNDRLMGEAGDDAVNGGTGDDTVFAGAGDDTLDGGSGSDTLDLTYATGETLTAFTAAGVGLTLGGGLDSERFRNVEAVAGSAFKDTVAGWGAGADRVYGRGGDDVLSGNGGADRLAGQEGDDTLSGGEGVDVLTGGNGRDTFVFDVALGAQNIDKITDYNPAFSGDRIHLDSEIFSAIPEGALQSNRLHIVGGNNTFDASDRIIYDPATGLMSYDVDGSGSAAAIVFAHLVNEPYYITASNIFVI